MGFKKVRCRMAKPQNVEIVNNPEDGGWPFVTQDGNEL